MISLILKKEEVKNYIYNDCIFKFVDGETGYQLKVVFLGHSSGK